jgi:hypothetical protein
MKEEWQKEQWVWSLRAFRRAAIWGHSVSFGLWMRSLGFLGTCVYFFMLTWNMKLFLPVRGFRDCLEIQSDLNRLVEWCEANALELNVGKCKSITFSRLRHPIEFSYMLGGITLDPWSCWLYQWLGSNNGQQGVFYWAYLCYGWKGLAMLGFVHSSLGYEMRLHI